MLTQEVDAYIEFLRLRHVTISEAPSSLVPPSTLLLCDVAQKLRGNEDIALLRACPFDKVQRAYVSYVRAYKEHQCSFIFQLKQLDYGALANQVLNLFFVSCLFLLVSCLFSHHLLIQRAAAVLTQDATDAGAKSAAARRHQRLLCRSDRLGNHQIQRQNSREGAHRSSHGAQGGAREGNFRRNAAEDCKRCETAAFNSKRELQRRR